MDVSCKLFIYGFRCLGIKELCQTENHTFPTSSDKSTQHSLVIFLCNNEVLRLNVTSVTPRHPARLVLQIAFVDGQLQCSRDAYLQGWLLVQHRALFIL